MKSLNLYAKCGIILTTINFDCSPQYRKSYEKQKAKINTNTNKNGATLGFEATLYQAADKLRNNMDAAEYKHVVLGLIFLKYISDSFAEKYNFLLQEFANPDSEFYIKEEIDRFTYAEDDEQFEDIMANLTEKLTEQMTEARRLDDAIAKKFANARIWR